MFTWRWTRRGGGWDYCSISGTRASSSCVTVANTMSDLSSDSKTRTTRSMSLTAAGRRLVEQAGPGLGQALGALTGALAQPGELVGRLKLTVPGSKAQRALPASRRCDNDAAPGGRRARCL
jgi:hypothetical protein